jgi:uncharacterized membrane protein YsdA (DUF1294 family)
MNLWLYLLIVNAVTYAMYWQDKRASRNRGAARVPEATLLLAGFLGGTLAAIAAQQVVRHKNKKQSFQFKFWALTALQIALLILQPAPLPLILSRAFG